MQPALILAIATAGFTTSPGFGDKVAPAAPLAPAPTQMQQGLKIEAIVDKGPTVEMIIRCGPNSAIVSYSKIEKLYCSPKLACDPLLARMLETTCGLAAGN